jgi:3-phosphoshikimate 1-carboxyvinyltransferase
VLEALFRSGPLRGEVRVAGDKSISHRALMLAALAPGVSTIELPNRGEDVLATFDAVEALGANLDDRGDAILVSGGRLHDPATTLDARNSGTTSRLLLGLCAGHGITAQFDGDASLRRRPMERVARPLRAMGAGVETSDGHLPAIVRGASNPPGGTFELEIPSAQVKSAILLANLGATGPVRITRDRRSRDHTERMLRHLGREIVFDGRTIELAPGRLKPGRMRVPADLSAAAFFIVAAAITPESDLLLREVGVNPTRTGLLDALNAMGADIELHDPRELDGEPVADLRVRYRPLRATNIDGELVVRAIDEIPILAVAAAYAEGTTRVRDAAELRAKESDRVAVIAETLRACGIDVTEHPDGFDVAGGGARPPAGTLATHGDHRIAMAIAALAAPAGPHAIDDSRCIAVSFPEFLELWRTAQS